MTQTDCICQFCGQPFKRPHLSGRIPKYCRASHRQRAHEKRILDEAVAAELKRRGLA